MAELEKTHHEENERHVFREIAVSADAPQHRGIAAIAQADALAAECDDPDAEDEERDGEDAGVERRDGHGEAPFLSNKAMDSTCAVCGNMLTTPAELNRKPLECTSTSASRASVAGSQET